MNLSTASFLFALVTSFAIFLRSTGTAPSKGTRKRLVSIHESIQTQSARDGSALEKAEPWGSHEHLERFLGQFQIAKRLNTLLLQSDSRLGLGGVVCAAVGCGCACGLMCYLFFQILPLALLLFGLAMLIPYGVLNIKRSRRVKSFNTALPDAIDLMARSLQAGHSMGSSIEMIAEQSPEPLALEFVQVFQQQRLGLQFRDSLLQMGERVPSRDLKFLITAILVQKETGGDLTEILARASHVIRERVRIEGEVGTRTAQGRLTGWILGLLPLIMLALINIVSPGYSSVLFHDPIGQDLLGVGAVFIVIGALIIRKIVDVKV